MHHFHAGIVIGAFVVVVAQQEHLNAKDGRYDEGERADKEGELGQDDDGLEEQRDNDGLGRYQPHDDGVQELGELLLALRLELYQAVAVEFLAT